MLVLFLCVVMISMARSKSDAFDAANADTLAEDAATSESNNNLWLGMILCICHAWLFSGVGVISRRLQNMHFSELMLHQAVQGIIIIGVVLAIQALFYDNYLLSALSAEQFGILLGGICVESLGLISMCVAFQAERTSVCSMIANLAIVYAALTDVFFFKESLSTTVLLGCGGVLILTTLLGVVKTCCAEPKIQIDATGHPHRIHSNEDEDDHFISSSKLDEAKSSSHNLPLPPSA